MLLEYELKCQAIIFTDIEYLLLPIIIGTTWYSRALIVTPNRFSHCFKQASAVRKLIKSTIKKARTERIGNSKPQTCHQPKYVLRAHAACSTHCCSDMQKSKLRSHVGLLIGLGLMRMTLITTGWLPSWQLFLPKASRNIVNTTSVMDTSSSDCILFGQSRTGQISKRKVTAEQVAFSLWPEMRYCSGEQRGQQKIWWFKLLFDHYKSARSRNCMTTQFCGKLKVRNSE